MLTFRFELWEKAFLETVRYSELKNFIVYEYTSSTLEKEIENNTLSILPYFRYATFVVIVFVMITCSTTDWVRSKPVLAIFGLIVAVMGTAAAFGLIMFFDAKFVTVNICSPFLMMGKTFIIKLCFKKALNPVLINLVSNFSSCK